MVRLRELQFSAYLGHHEGDRHPRLLAALVVVLVVATASAFAGIADSPSGSMSKGSARILATSKKIACTAWVADIANDPPISSFALTIIAKTKQKAAN